MTITVNTPTVEITAEPEWFTLDYWRSLLSDETLQKVDSRLNEIVELVELHDESIRKDYSRTNLTLDMTITEYIKHKSVISQAVRSGNNAELLATLLDPRCAKYIEMLDTPGAGITGLIEGSLKSSEDSRYLTAYKNHTLNLFIDAHRYKRHTNTVTRNTTLFFTLLFESDENGMSTVWFTRLLESKDSNVAEALKVSSLSYLITLRCNSESKLLLSEEVDAIIVQGIIKGQNVPDSTRSTIIESARAALGNDVPLSWVEEMISG